MTMMYNYCQVKVRYFTNDQPNGLFFFFLGGGGLWWLLEILGKI